MNLISLIKKEQVEQAKRLVTQGLINYQPFIFSEDLQTGVGYEFIAEKEGAGLVYWPTIPAELLKSPEMKRFIIDNPGAKDFIEANKKLRAAYDGFINQICGYAGDIKQCSVADMGCNSGYFPVSFSQRGARLSVGYDRQDYSEPFALLNEILKTKAIFNSNYYDGSRNVAGDQEQYDIVISMMVLCHLSDPLKYLSFLGNSSKKMVFIWTLVSEDDDYAIRFGEPNTYYKNDAFPYCFDNLVRPSVKLIRKSLQLMGFTEIHEIQNEGKFPDVFYNIRNKAILAIRP